MDEPRFGRCAGCPAPGAVCLAQALNHQAICGHVAANRPGWRARVAMGVEITAEQERALRRAAKPRVPLGTPRRG